MYNGPMEGIAKCFVDSTIGTMVENMHCSLVYGDKADIPTESDRMCSHSGHCPARRICNPYVLMEQSVPFKKKK